MVLLISTSHAKEDILIVTEEWAPYNYSVDGKVTGFSTEIVQNILKVLKKNYEIQIMPSMRTTRTLKNRPRTMMISMFRTPERESKYKWIGPLVDASIYFYKRRDNPLKIENLNDLKNVKSICSRHAGLIPKLLTEKGFKNVDKGGTRGIQIYQRLLLGRCDLAISDADLGVRYNLKQLNIKDNMLEKIPISIFDAKLYIVASNDISDEEIQQWQTALDTLKANGIYEKIYQAYQ